MHFFFFFLKKKQTVFLNIKGQVNFSGKLKKKKKKVKRKREKDRKRKKEKAEKLLGIFLTTMLAF
jgi:hypothetical protein